jgi:hypothetical protein
VWELRQTAGGESFPVGWYWAVMGRLRWRVRTAGAAGRSVDSLAPPGWAVQGLAGHGDVRKNGGWDSLPACAGWAGGSHRVSCSLPRGRPIEGP